ncbi:MAG: Fe(3+) ABC transporter substrate-binding protein [Nitrospiria bacterium]
MKPNGQQYRRIGFSLIFLFVFLAFEFSVAAIVFGNEEVVVYSARKEHLIKPVIDAYTKETGVQVKLITDKAAPLLVRLKAEGKNTPADLFLTVDAGNLWQAAEEGVLLPLRSNRLNANIPAHLRDPKGRWVGLSVRARTIVYNTNKVNPSGLSTYENLGTPAWKGRLCLRTSKKVYNQSLVAMMISELGESKSEKIVKSWVGNLATDVFSSDTKVMEAIVAGQCDVGIVNTYYYGRLKRKDPKLPLALFWPNQKGRGVHVNISGGGVTRHTRHKTSAIRLLEWLSSPSAQNLFADGNLEYPVNPKVKPVPEVAAWGAFKPDQINVSKAGELQRDAIKLMDRAGYR